MLRSTDLTFYSFEKTKESVGFFYFNNLIATNVSGIGEEAVTESSIELQNFKL